MSPLNRVLGLGAARGAAEHWWVQRLTAVALVPLGLWLAVGFLLLDDFSYEALTAWIRRPLSSILFILTALAAAYHSHLGVQVVIEDYVHTNALKLAALITSSLAHAALAVAAVFAVLRIAFGSAP